jgi:uncharacterized protein YceK
VNKLVAITLAGWAIALNGCGTMGDIMCGPVPVRYYAGVQNDATVVEGGARKLLSMGPSERFKEPRNFGQAILCVGLGLADMPLSAVADTILLPMAFASRQAWADPPVHVWGSQLGKNAESEPETK